MLIERQRNQKALNVSCKQRNNDFLRMKSLIMRISDKLDDEWPIGIVVDDGTIIPIKKKGPVETEIPPILPQIIEEDREKRKRAPVERPIIDDLEDEKEMWKKGGE